jgi:hypothetical protein
VFILALYTSPCAHAFPLGDTIRFICPRSTSSWCADMHLTPFSCQSQDGFSQWYARRDLRLAIMPTGSVVCMCRPPMRDVGTCPMIEATYLSNTRPSMRIDESVARSQIRMWQECVCVVLLLATKKPKVCLVMAVDSEATDRYTLASLHMPRYVSGIKPRSLSDRLIVTWMDSIRGKWYG